MKRFGIAGLALALIVQAAPSRAGEAVNLILNWTPTADHSPFYYAKAQGWYEKAGIDLTIETGKGSGVSSLKVGSGGSPFGIADLACPSADDLRLIRRFEKGGSGSSGLEFKRPAADAASGGLRWLYA
jgi:ABC-type nitrate/sulfonate/bicarbonate transport system substrate-binding protein